MIILRMTKFSIFYLVMAIMLMSADGLMAQPGEKWIEYEPKTGPGNGRYIVLVGGDEEYRSEEALPMMARILSEYHGFQCTVLFALDPESGEINPDNQNNIPGLEKLKDADLMILFTRFRELPDEQMKYIDAYVKSGKPIVAMRTSTHAFKYSGDNESPFAKYSFDSKVKGWEDGFGRQVLGETWVNHHGAHGKEGCRAIINGTVQNHALLRGVKDIWVPTDVYGIRNLANATVLLYGQSTNGMTPDSPPNLEKSVMPVAWTTNYISEIGNTSRIFSTTMGASVDLQNEDLRRLMVNACYWALGIDAQITESGKVDIIGEYEPTKFGFGDYVKGRSPKDYQ